MVLTAASKLEASTPTHAHHYKGVIEVAMSSRSRSKSISERQTEGSPYLNARRKLSSNQADCSSGYVAVPAVNPKRSNYTNKDVCCVS